MRYRMPERGRFGSMNNRAARCVQLAVTLLLGAAGHIRLAAHTAWLRTTHVLIFLANIPFDIIFFFAPFFFMGIITFFFDFFNGLGLLLYWCVSASCLSSTDRSGSS